MSADSKKQPNIVGEINDTEKQIRELIVAREGGGAQGEAASGLLKEQYKALKEASAAGVCIYKDGRIEEANIEFASMLGFQTYEVFGLGTLSFVQTADREKIASRMKSGQEDPCEVELVRKDGTSLYAWVKARNMEFNGGTASALTFFDISDFVESRAELEDELDFLECAYNNLPDPFYIADLSGRLMRWNRAMKTVSGYSDEELSGMSITDFVAKEDIVKVGEAVNESFEKGVGKVIEVTAVTRDGKRIPFEFYGGILADGDENPIGVCGVGREISSRRRALKIVELQRDLALKVMEAKGLPQVFEICLDVVLKATGLDSGSIYLYDHSAGTFEMVRSIGLSEPFILAARHMSAESRDVSQLKAGKPVYRVHEMLAVSRDGAEIGERLKCLALVPLSHSDVLLGCLSVTSHTLEEIPRESKALIEALIAQIGRHIVWAQQHFAEQVYQKLSKYLFQSPH
ncbi:MAG: PAS domain S-box protein [Actinobacteria bacterium]|nr:PAS domain S-box protein [Actinomycetota bacterium]